MYIMYKYNRRDRDLRVCNAVSSRNKNRNLYRRVHVSTLWDDIS